MAVRESVGVTDLSYRSIFRVTGTDRASWVHGLVTNDVDNLKEGSGLYAAMLSHIGRMITDLKVYARPEHLILDIHPANAGKVADILKKSIISEDVELEDLTQLLAIISVNGPRSSELVKDLFKQSFSRLGEYDNVAVPFDDNDVLVVKDMHLGEEGLNLFVQRNSAPALWRSVLDALEDNQTQPFGLTAYDSLRLESGRPEFMVDMDESTIPLEARLEKAIHFNKGCYTGQEVIARVRRMVLSKMFLIGMVFDGQKVPVKGDKLYERGREVGRITSSTWSPVLKRPIALGYVVRDLAKAGTSLYSSNENLAAQVVDVPFVRKE